MSLLMKRSQLHLSSKDAADIGQYLGVAAVYLRTLIDPLGVRMSGELAKRLTGYADHCNALRDKLKFF